MCTRIHSTVTLPIGTIFSRGLCRSAIALLFIGAAILGPVIHPPAAHAQVNINIFNPGASRPGGTAGTIYLSDLGVRLTNGTTIMRTFSPPRALNSLARNPGTTVTIPGITVADIAGVVPSSRPRLPNGMFGPERATDPGLTEGRRVQLSFLPTLDDPQGNPLVLVTDFNLYQNPPDPGTVLSFTNGLNPAEPDWFVATAFDENTFAVSGAYTGLATVANPVMGIQITSVPEPSALGTALLGTMVGTVGMLCRRIRLRKRKAYPASLSRPVCVAPKQDMAAS